jgi:hypothetical protein
MSNQNGYALARLQEQINAVKAKISLINAGEMIDYSGNRFDDTLMAVTADSQRDYWETKLLELETLLGDYLGMRNYPAASDGVMEGDIVKLERIADAHKLQFRLAARVELFPDERCMTLVSPVGSAVLGKKPGDKITIQTPAGLVEYLILEIDRGE